MKPSTIKLLVTHALKNEDPSKRLNPLLVGSPGIGKTELMLKIASELNWKWTVMHPVISDPTDFKGLPWPDKDKLSATFLPFGDLKKLIDTKEPLLCIIDDLIQAPIAVQAAAMQLLHGGRLNDNKLSSHVRFVSATNRAEDKAGGSTIIEPLKSRFAIWPMEPDLDDWTRWALDNKIPTYVIAFIRWRPSLLFEFKPSKQIEAYPCPRSVHNLAKFMEAGNIPVEHEIDAFSGIVGKGFAGEFAAFIKIYRDLPNPDRVLLDPKNAKIPTDPATLYALCSALAERASESTAEAIAIYSTRLNDSDECTTVGANHALSEFSIFLMKMALSKNEEVISNTHSFIKWGIEHTDILSY